MDNYFSPDELACKCGCNFLNISEDLVEQLNLARELSDTPFYINSACRCPSHNEESGGSDTSSHIATEDIECTAVDIRAISSRSRYNILNSLLRAGFTRIGISDTFIHVDIDSSKSPEVIWTY